MGFLSDRRFWSFLLFNAAILVALTSIYLTCKRQTPPPVPVSASPTPGVTAPQTAAPSPEAPSPVATAAAPAKSPTPEADSYQPTTDQDAVHLDRLVSKDVQVTSHKIKSKENYWTIAKDNHIDVYTLIGGNPELPYQAGTGRSLNILSKKGVLHTVVKGETPSSIAKAYKIEEKGIQQENGLSWWRSPKPGDVLFIPEVRPIRMRKEWHDYFNQRGFFGDPLGTWGRWTSNFGWRIDPFTGDKRHHSGLDLKAKYGDPVYAAASGRVIYAGVSGGYGNLIQIRHNSTYLTMYGHLSKILVKSGAKVKRGSLIGKVGATGRVTGPHLHFEIRKNGKAINPLPLI